MLSLPATTITVQPIKGFSHPEDASCGSAMIDVSAGLGVLQPVVAAFASLNLPPALVKYSTFHALPVYVPAFQNVGSMV